MRKIKNIVLSSLLIAAVSSPIALGIFSFSVGALSVTASAPVAEFTLQALASVAAALVRVAS
jgi:hypothetical protein